MTRRRLSGRSSSTAAISITEDIDTDRKGWQTHVGLTELHHSRSNEDTAERVRGAQEGRVRSPNGSAGDFPYGYASEYDDPVAAANYHGRGSKPSKHVVICEPAAKLVRAVFEMFVAGESISAIVTWWEEHKAEHPPITKTMIHHQHVRRMLANPKYIGAWTFGETTTVREGRRKKQIKAFSAPLSPQGRRRHPTAKQRYSAVLLRM
jgi:site-specific DNA recombinase